MAIPFHSDIQLFDSNEIKLGTSSDLRLYHDGSNSYVNDSGTGVLVISSSQTNMQVGGANKLIVGTNDITILDNIALDIGTGGGFPGIPLAILFPETNFYLVDSIGKKIKVVTEVATALGLLAAIPAVVAYNKFNNDSKKYSEKLENFSKRFLTII